MTLHLVSQNNGDSHARSRHVTPSGWGAHTERDLADPARFGPRLRRAVRAVSSRAASGPRPEMRPKRVTDHRRRRPQGRGPGSGGVAGELPEHAVAPAALVDAVLAAVGV